MDPRHGMRTRATAREAAPQRHARARLRPAASACIPSDDPVDGTQADSRQTKLERCRCGSGAGTDLPVRPANSGRVDIMKRPVSWAQTSTLHDFSTTTTSTFCGMHCPGAEVWSSLKGAPERPLSPPPSRPCHPQVSPPAMRRVLLLLPRHCHRVVGIARGCASRRQSPPHGRHRPPHRRRQSPPPSPVHHCPVPSPLGGAAPPRSRPRRRHRLHR